MNYYINLRSHDIPSLLLKHLLYVSARETLKDKDAMSCLSTEVTLSHFSVHLV